MSDQHGNNFGSRSARGAGTGPNGGYARSNYSGPRSSHTFQTREEEEAELAAQAQAQAQAQQEQENNTQAQKSRFGFFRGKKGSDSANGAGSAPNGSAQNGGYGSGYNNRGYGSNNYGSSSSGRGGYAGSSSTYGGGGYGGGYTGGGNYGGGASYGGGGVPPQFENGMMVSVPWELYELRKKPQHGGLCQALMTIGSVITFARNLVFNIIFLLLLFFIFGGYMAVQSIKDSGLLLSGSNIVTQIDPNALPAEVLYFDLKGNISEIPFGSSQIDNLQRQLEYSLYGRQSHELVAVENALRLVATDPQIKKVVISVDGMGPITLSIAERLGKAIDMAKGHGQREVIVMGMGISQAAYALAAHADRIVLDSLGEIDLKGIALSSLYFKDLLDRFELTPYIFRAGHYKSAVEPFMLNSMSPDVRREFQAIAFKSWEIYQKSITDARSIKTPTLLPEANVYVNWLTQFHGDRAQMQLAQGLVDEIKSAEDYLMELAQEVNVDADAPYFPAIITYQDYLMRHHVMTTGKHRLGSLSEVEVKPVPASPAQSASISLAAAAAAGELDGVLPQVLRAVPTLAESVAAVALSAAGEGQQPNAVVGGSSEATAATTLSRTNRATRSKRRVGGNEVAVLYGVGELTDISDSPNAFTYDNLAPLIEEAQHDSSVGALVLYLNSPGGSVIASEKIRRALELFQQSGKPLVISMNGTAASGAYWIASQGDAIFATPSTITGSIGVFGIGFGAHRLLNRYGAYQDGVVTNDLALSAIAEEMPASQQRMLSLSVENTYRNFIELVARNRGLKVNEYEIFAEGQIFLADDARTVGLIDEIGDVNDAIQYASRLAGISQDRLKIHHVAPSLGSELGGLESLFFGLSASYLPEELTYALVELKTQSKMLRLNEPKSIMAIAPISEPQL